MLNNSIERYEDLIEQVASQMADSGVFPSQVRAYALDKCRDLQDILKRGGNPSCMASEIDTLSEDLVGLLEKA